MNRELVVWLMCSSAACSAIGCTQREAARAIATGEMSDKDDQPATGVREAGELRLSVAAQRAIGLHADEISLQDVAEELRLLGRLNVRPGRESTIKAPAAGLIRPIPGASWPEIGDRVDQGHRLAQLEAYVSPLEQAQLVIAKEEADTIIEQSQLTMQFARQQLDALEKSAPGVVSGSRLKELQETYEKARAAAEQSRDKLKFLPHEPYQGNLRLGAIDLTCPHDGRVTAVHIGARQMTAAGEPLFTVADWSVLWVRVPVFPADAERVLHDEPASIVSSRTSAHTLLKPAPGGLPTTPDQYAVDLYFELANPRGQFMPGQAVTVALPTTKSQSRLVVATSALMWDSAGSAWLFVRTGPETFCRRKIEVGSRVSGGVVIARGLQPGEQVVTVGAAALYGEEFKGEIPMNDDD